MKIDVMGLKFDSMTMDEALSRAEALLRGEKAAYVVTPNAEIAYEALHDGQLREMLNGADLMLPDGAGVVLASKLLRTPVKQKVAGVDFAAATSKAHTSTFRSCLEKKQSIRKRQARARAETVHSRKTSNRPGVSC